MYRTDVFADDSQCDQLNGAEEEEAENDWGDADVEVGPEDQLVNQVEHAGEKADERRDEADEDDQAQGHLGQIGDAQHREVVQRVEVLAGDSPLAAVLVVFDPGDRKTEFGDDAAEIGVGIAEVIADLVDDGAVVEAEAGEVLHDANVGEARDEAVIGGADAEHEAVLVAGLLNGGDNGGAVLPGADHVGEELGGILEGGYEDPDGVALGLEEGVHAGAVGADVAGVDYDLYGGVLGGDLAEDADGVVGGGVVDEEVLKAILREAGGDGHEAAMDLADVELPVVAGGHDCDHPGGRCIAVKFR